MLSYTLWRALATPVTYVLLAILISTAIMQVKYVNKALQRFDSTQVIPVQFVMFTLSVIIGSAILYRDFEKASAENLVKFVGGCLLTFFGVWLITSGRSQSDGPDDEDESDEEGDLRIDLAEQDQNDTRYSDVAPPLPPITKKPALFQNGDSANDSQIEHSRRTSHVSFAGPSPRPYTPRLHSSSSSHGTIQVITSLPLPEEQNSNTEVTPLLTDPWNSQTNNNERAQVVLLAAQVSSESPKPPNTRSSTHGNLHTHPNLQQSPVVQHPDRPFTPTRHSMLGPLMSPLSGGLSVVIADSIRRGIETPARSRPIRRSRLGQRRSNSGSHRLIHGLDGSEDAFVTSSVSAIDTSQDVSKSLETASGDWSRVTRTRSLSNTLGELLRGKKRRVERTVTGDDEAGPSGS